MKKFLASILLMTYLTATCGVVINHHYCMNRLDSTQLFSVKQDICGKCGMHSDDSEGCCRDEVKVLKIDDDQQKTSSHIYSFNSPEAVVRFASLYIDLPGQNADITRHFQNHSPPLLGEQDTYLQNRVFRI